MTTTPRMATLSRTYRIASTAALSAASLSPRPIQRAAAIAPASVTRTSSIAMFRSGACLVTALHPLRCLDADELETPCDHRPGRPAERESERFLLALEDAVLVVEAVEVVGDADRVCRNPLRPPPLGRLAHHRRKLRQPLDELPLFDGERFRKTDALPLLRGRVSQCPGDACVRVLDVVHGILLGALGSEVDVDLDRLVRPAIDEKPAGRVDADLVEKVVEEDDVAASLRHLRQL